MKQVLLGCMAVFVCGSLCAQKLKESDVPAVVKSSFLKSFPNARDVKWSKESDSEFEAEFKSGSLEQSVNFDTQGKWLVTETEIRKADLPASVYATIKKEFDGFKVDETEKVESPEGIAYEVELEKGQVMYSIQFSNDGKILKKDEKKGSAEDEGKD